MPTSKITVIPAQAGIQVVYPIDFQRNQPYELDSLSPPRKRGLRGNDGRFVIVRGR